MPISVFRWGPVKPYGANKGPKLKGYLADITKQSVKTLVAIGGPNSNLLWAVAEMARNYGYRSIGLIRGTSLRSAQLEALGMKQISIPAGMYRDVCDKGPSAMLPELWQSLEKPYFIPEGASTPLALVGVIEEAQKWPRIKDAIWVVPVGTGATMAGIALGLWPTQVIGFAPFKDEVYCADLVNRFLNTHHPQIEVEVYSVTEFGKYGRPSKIVLDRLEAYKQETGIALNPIYAGFCLVALEEKIKEGQLDPIKNYVIVDTGGHYDMPIKKEISN